MLDDAIATIDAHIESLRADGSIPGLVLAVTDRNGIVVDRRYGFAEVATARPVGPDTLFEIGSIGKTFCAVIVMQLVEEGRLAVDDPAMRHLPWFKVPRTGERITIRHLLSHTAGITSGVDGTPEHTFQVWRLRDLPPGSAPGRRFHYSNVGFKVVQLVIEAIEGAAYPDVLRRRVLAPLGMTSSEPAITNDIRPRLAVGYEPVRDDRVWYEGAPLLPATWLETGTADGAIASTATDMTAFVRLLLREGDGPAGRLISPASFAEMTTPVRAKGSDGYGLGIYSADFSGRRYFGHTGGMVGYIAGMWCDPASGLGAVVLQNGPGHGPNLLSRQAIRVVAAALEGGDPAAAIAAMPWARPEPEEAAPFVGSFTGSDGRTFQTEIVGADLILHDGLRPITLNHFGDGWCGIPDPDWDAGMLLFDEDGAGAWHASTRFERDGTAPAPLPEPDPALLPLVGYYRSHDPWTTNFRIVLRGDVPWLRFTAAPDGFEEEQPLVPMAGGWFRVGTDPLGPERMRFDTIIGGHYRRAWLSGWDYYRMGDP